MKLERWIRGLLLCASLLLGTSCERLKKAIATSEAEVVEEEVELGEEYVLAVRDPEYAKGFTMTTTMKMAAPEIEATVKVGQKEVEGTSVRSAVSHTVVQVLGKDLKRVTVQMEKSNEAFRMTGGPSKVEETKGPLVGQYVLLERKEGPWVARFESGKEPNAEERKAMDVWAEASNEVPEQETRRLGEEWEEDIEFPGKGKAKLRFERVGEYQGQQCAVIVGMVKISEKTVDGGNYVIEGRTRTFRSLEHFQDLYSEMEGEITGTSYPQLGLTVQLKGPMTMTMTTVLGNPTADAAAARAEEEAAEAAAKRAEEAAKAAEAAAQAAAAESGRGEESAVDPVEETVEE